MNRWMIRSVAERVALVIIVCPQIRCQLDLEGCQSASAQFESMLDRFAEAVHERYLAETLLYTWCQMDLQHCLV